MRENKFACKFFYTESTVINFLAFFREIITSLLMKILYKFYMKGIISNIKRLWIKAPEKSHLNILRACSIYGYVNPLFASVCVIALIFTGVLLVKRM
jgi:hypothetical protein